jgi:uncharacterized protein
VSNTVGLVPGGLTASWGFRRELAGKRRLVWAVAGASVLGALGGAVVLLGSPESAFEAAVPWLVLFAATLVGIQPLLSRWLNRLRPQPPGTGSTEGLGWPLTAVTTVIGGYGGYFGAGQGIMLVGFLALALRERLQVINGLKNVAVLAANVGGASVFLLAGPVDLKVAGLIAAGSTVGGWLGAHIGRRLPASVFRFLVVAFGYVVGLRLLVT